MQTEPPNADPPKCKRRCFHFSLRTLLIVTAVVALGCALLTPLIEQKRKEREATDAIIKSGGRVVYDYQIAIDGEFADGAEPPPGPSLLRALLGDNFFGEVSVCVAGPDMTDDGMEAIKAFVHLRELVLEATEITDGGMKRLGRLPELEKLNLNATRITDAGLVNLKAMTQLRELKLGSTRVTNAGLQSLSGLSQLKMLVLEGTEVTDAGLAELIGLRQLQSLALGYTKITDAGLKQLKGLSQLQCLWLQDANVTDGGVKDLQTSLPDCQINLGR